MFWGCISMNGVGTLTKVEGNIDSEKYINVLEQKLRPVIAKDFQNKPWIFQEDNCPMHGSERTRQWKAENAITCLAWPSQSTDINIIENVWRTIKYKLETMLQKTERRTNLIRIVKEIWASLEPGKNQDLYNSLPRRLKAVVKAKGSITKY